MKAPELNVDSSTAPTSRAYTLRLPLRQNAALADELAQDAFRRPTRRGAPFARSAGAHLAAAHRPQRCLDYLRALRRHQGGATDEGGEITAAPGCEPP
jgi:hypothetical protein